MKRTLSRGGKIKGARRAKAEAPVELERGWQELEVQADRLRDDWGSLAAQFVMRGRGKPGW